jgi:DNA invertase Pin-like site-specific DNA recombinase
MTDTAALYARVSTDNQNIEPQVTDLEDWAGYQDVDYQVFKDDGVSAIADSRPGFEYLMDRVEDFDMVVVQRLDRLGRSVNELSSWAADLNDRGIDLVVTEQGLDTSTHEGELLFHMLSAIAEYERKLTRERMEAGYKEALEEGRVGRKKKDVDLEELEEKWENGAGATYLANHFNVSRTTIYDRLHDLELLAENGA